MASKAEVAAARSALDRILDSLEDGEWHYLADLATNTATSLKNIEAIAEFLTQYGIADDTIKVNYEQIRLKPTFLALPL